MCPNCHRNAPVVHRGVMAYCTACGAPRPPLAGTSVSLAGQPSKIGGAVARTLGWGVLVLGLLFALVLGAILQTIFPAGVAGYAIGFAIAFLTLAIGIALVRGGGRLNQRGARAEKDARNDALFALAAHRGGALTAADAAQTLAIPVERADALLTALAKERYEHVSIEIDPQGGVYYRFAPGAGAGAGGARVRVDPEVARSPNRAEWERLEREEAAANDAKEARRAR